MISRRCCNTLSRVQVHGKLYRSYVVFAYTACFVSRSRIRINSRAALFELPRPVSRTIAHDRPPLGMIPTSELAAEPYMKCMLCSRSHYHATKKKNLWGLSRHMKACLSGVMLFSI